MTMQGIGRVVEDLYALGFTAHTFAGNSQDARYGYHLVLDIEECDPTQIDDPGAIRAWLRGWADRQPGLVQQIGMTAHGEPHIESFAHDDPVTAGYTAVQLIETSSITAHFSPHLRTAHIDVFSCRWFPPAVAVAHTLDTFGTMASKGHATFLPRG
jgi:S-adenosylmethionine/arginine decarboxylase-like enzyme